MQRICGRKYKLEEGMCSIYITPFMISGCSRHLLQWSNYVVKSLLDYWLSRLLWLGCSMWPPLVFALGLKGNSVIVPAERQHLCQCIQYQPVLQCQHRCLCSAVWDRTWTHSSESENVANWNTADTCCRMWSKYPGMIWQKVNRRVCMQWKLPGENNTGSKWSQLDSEGKLAGSH